MTVRAQRQGSMATVDIVERSWSGSKSGRCGGAFYFAQTEKCLMRYGISIHVVRICSAAPDVPWSDWQYTCCELADLL